MRLTKFFVLLAVGVFSAAAAIPVAAQSLTEKIPLKVLYVGYDPAKPMPDKVVYYSTSPAVVEQVYKTRMVDFRNFLESRFKEVEAVDCRDYRAEMSDKADVTILDAGPVNLPADFDRPVILMHAMAPNVGQPIGLKFDWYCQCLEDDALNINTKHEIFNKPLKVKLTLVKRPTPQSFFNGFRAPELPKEMLMWKVIKEGQSKNGKYIIGMVSHGEGFNDSPDAESISGGVCLKNAEAVALGRQGNYFMWGFSASPDYMTDEAKDVFVNAVCYIKKFDHKRPIVKKVQIETREWVDERIYRTDKSLYEKAIVSRREGNARMLKLQQELKNKKAAGEDIGYANEMFLKMPVSNETETFEHYLENQAGSDLFARFGTNTSLYHKYYKDNYEYFYPLDAYTLQLDTDAQKLGISNRKVTLLEKCISMLDENKDAATARRLLERYTTEKFTTAAEWKAWLSKNKGNLFFTEAGGFKFMVNTFGRAPENTTVTADSSGVTKPTANDPVAVSAKLVYSEDKKKADLVISATLLKGWHIYALVPEDSPFIVTEPKLELPDGVKVVKDWETSAALPFADNKGVFVFEDKASFKVTIDCAAVKPGTVIKCGLFYQTCNDNKCLQPTTKMLEIHI